MADPAFRSDAERGKNEILAIDGEEIQAMIAKVATAPRTVLDKLTEALNYKGDASEIGKSDNKSGK